MITFFVEHHKLCIYTISFGSWFSFDQLLVKFVLPPTDWVFTEFEEDTQIRIADQVEHELYLSVKVEGIFKKLLVPEYDTSLPPSNFPHVTLSIFM